MGQRVKVILCNADSRHTPTPKRLTLLVRVKRAGAYARAVFIMHSNAAYEVEGRKGGGGGGRAHHDASASGLP